MDTTTMSREHRRFMGQCVCMKMQSFEVRWAGNRPQHSLSRPSRIWSWLTVIGFALGLACPARALTITPIFDNSITSDPYATNIEATINAAIAVYAANFSDPVDVSILFMEDPTVSLGASLSQPPITVLYSSYLAALAVQATTTDDGVALASLPPGLNNPVDGTPNINLHLPLARALGFSADPAQGQPDGTIYLNTSVMNLSDTDTNPTKYYLSAVVSHEIDEVLGFDSALNAFNQGALAPGLVCPEDLFRYAQNGARSLTNDPAAICFFSLDGQTDLAQFNQQAGFDFHDWHSPDRPPRVQDAAGTPGAKPVLDLELRVLDVIGFSRFFTPPQIQRFFSSALGDDVRFEVDATGGGLQYQWYWQGLPIPGATNNVLEYVHATRDASAGYYSVTVSNVAGQTNSPPPGLLFTKTIPQGNYKGLFFNGDPAAVDLRSSGRLQLAVLGPKGKFTGQLVFSNHQYPFSGVFTNDQSSLVAVSGTPLRLALQLVATNGTGQIFGTVSGSGWTSALAAHQVFYGQSNPFPLAGRFTVAMFDTNLLSVAPPLPTPTGASFATLTAGSGGTVSLFGRVGDGTAFSESWGLSENGDFGLFVPLQGGRGAIFGWLQISGQTNTVVQGGPVFWLKGAGPDRFYPQGFHTVLQALGSAYSGGTNGQVLTITNGVASYTGGDYYSSGGSPVWDSASVRAVPTAAAQPTTFYYSGSGLEHTWLGIGAGGGNFTGHFVDQITGRQVEMRGVVLQQQNAAYGYFLSGNTSGYMSLQPLQ